MREMGKSKPLFSFATERPSTGKKGMDNLSKDAIAAQRAGVSYGQYMARQRDMGRVRPPEKKEETNPRLKHELVCAICGAKFKSVTRMRKYCSDSCKYKADRKRKGKGEIS